MADSTPKSGRSTAPTTTATTTKATAPTTSTTAPPSAVRSELASIRATLLVWGTRGDGPELRAFDAWAVWVMSMLGERRGRTPLSVPPHGSHREARLAALELTLAVLRQTAGMSSEERAAVWSQAQAGEQLVVAMLVRTTRRKASGAPATAATTGRRR